MDSATVIVLLKYQSMQQLPLEIRKIFGELRIQLLQPQLAHFAEGFDVVKFPRKEDAHQRAAVKLVNRIPDHYLLSCLMRHCLKLLGSNGSIFADSLLELKPSLANTSLDLQIDSIQWRKFNTFDTM